MRAQTGRVLALLVWRPRPNRGDFVHFVRHRCRRHGYRGHTCAAASMHRVLTIHSERNNKTLRSWPFNSGALLLYNMRLAGGQTVALCAGASSPATHRLHTVSEMPAPSLRPTADSERTGAPLTIQWVAQTCCVSAPMTSQPPPKTLSTPPTLSGERRDRRTKE